MASEGYPELSRGREHLTVVVYPRCSQQRGLVDCVKRGFELIVAKHQAAEASEAIVARHGDQSLGAGRLAQLKVPKSLLSRWWPSIGSPRPQEKLRIYVRHILLDRDLELVIAREEFLHFHWNFKSFDGSEFHIHKAGNSGTKIGYQNHCPLTRHRGDQGRILGHHGDRVLELAG